MASWGSSTFEDEDASDWLGSFESDGPAAVDTALKAVLELDANEYVQMTEASCAVAAAEVVAAARDGEVARLPEEFHDALVDHRDAVNEGSLAKLAHRALARVMRNSELKDHHDEEGNLEGWSDEMRELMERLKG